jgi:hypothetical protein
MRSSALSGGIVRRASRWHKSEMQPRVEDEDEAATLVDEAQLAKGDSGIVDNVDINIDGVDAERKVKKIVIVGVVIKSQAFL